MDRTDTSSSSPSRLDGVADRVAGGIQRRSSIDPRALAAFRIGLGSLVCLDLLLRSRNLVAFYTDAGVLPRRALFSDYSEVYSIHAHVGDPWLVGLLFVVAALIALAMVVGYRTRLATILTWGLLFSLHARNPMVLNAGDTLLLTLLFWAMFLPLGDRWAVDARRIDRDRSAVASIATLAVLLQIVLMYAVNGYHKARSDEWMSGEAVAYIFQADQLTHLLGNVLADYPLLLELTTYSWVALVFTSPLLLALTGRKRAVYATLFAGMHLGMFVTMTIGLFPLISVVGLLLFYPQGVWDAATRLVTRNQPRSSTVARIRAIEVRDPIAVATERVRSRLPDSPNLDRGIDVGRSTFTTVVPYVFLVLILLSNASAIGYGDVPEPGDEALETVEMDQHWRMFAPDPTSTTRWFAESVTLSDGTEVDAFHGGEVDRDRPPDAAASYPTFRWRKYKTSVRFANNENHRSYYANYLCGRWERDTGTEPDRVTVYYAFENTDPYTGEVTGSGDRTLVDYLCSGPLVQGRTIRGG